MSGWRLGSAAVVAFGCLVFVQLSEFCFAEICLGTEKLLFEFIEAFASSKKSPERLFPLLESYETLNNVQPTYDEIFAGAFASEALPRQVASLAPCRTRSDRFTMRCLQVGEKLPALQGRLVAGFYVRGKARTSIYRR